MSDSPNSEAKGKQKPRGSLRWWPAAALLFLTTVAIIWVRSLYGRQRQDQNIATAKVFAIAVLLLLVWWLFFSRVRWKLRWAALGAMFVIGLSVPALFRIHGVTGDLVPILEWRWKAKPLWTVQRGAEARTDPRPLSQFTNDYPQFLGPHRNSTVTAVQLARDWEARPPQRLWQQPAGAGWSGFAVAGQHAITLEQRGDQEGVICYELTSGRILWTHSYPAHYQSELAGEGPRSTPTIAGQRVFTLGATGILNCLELGTGKLLWSQDVIRDNHAHLSEWGMSCSPLLTEDLVVVSAGGKDGRSLVAYRADTGEFVWGGGNHGAGYSSPIFTKLAGIPQIVIFNSGGVVSHAPSDGKVLWEYPWPGGHPHVSTPVILPEDRVLVSSGYGVGSELLKIAKASDGPLSVVRIWKSNRLKAKFANLLYHAGHIYGLDDGIMACLDASTGQQKWKEGRYGHGQEILAGDLLLVVAESGEVILIEPVPEELRVLSRFTALPGKTWNPPALAGEFLLVRNDKEAACYRLPVLVGRDRATTAGLAAPPRPLGDEL